MEKRESGGEVIGRLIGDIFGFFWCLAILCGFYVIGAWTAQYFLGDGHRDAVGVLAAVAFVWLYERQRADNRWQQMNEKLDRLFDRLRR